MTHTYPIRVYYEDTDMGGIVYHANYLKFIERARSDWVRGLGVDQVAMKEDGIAFAVRRVEADYLGPARFDDLLDVETELVETTAARIALAQRVWRDETLLFDAKVILVALTGTGRPARLPAEFRHAIGTQRN